MALIKSTMVRGRRGRPRSNQPVRRWNITLPEDVAAPWDIIFMDPVNGRSRYSSKTKVFSAILRTVFQAWREGRNTVDISHINQLLNSNLGTAEGVEEVKALFPDKGLDTSD